MAAVQLVCLRGDTAAGNAESKRESIAAPR